MKELNSGQLVLFAKKARELRLDAKQSEAKGDMDAAQCAIYQALGVESAVIEVAQKLNPKFEAGSFREVCNPDLPLIPAPNWRI